MTNVSKELRIRKEFLIIFLKKAIEGKKSQINGSLVKIDKIRLVINYIEGRERIRSIQNSLSIDSLEWSK